MVVPFNAGDSPLVDGAGFQQILRGEVPSAEFAAEYPFYPLTSPGMPIPGPTFLSAAEAMHDPVPVFDGERQAEKRLVTHGPALHYLYRRALYDPRFSMRVAVRAAMLDAPMLPGHLMSQTIMHQSGGPREARVMVVYRCPGQDEMAYKCHLAGDSANILLTALVSAGADGQSDWYITPVVKWPIVNVQSSTIPQAHKKDNAILLEQELRLVQPDFILCLGADAVQAILGAGQSVRSMLGRVAERVINLTAPGQQSRFKTAKVMVCESPSAVVSLPEKMDDFVATVTNFVKLTRGVEVGKIEEGLRHVNVYKQRQLRSIVDEIRSDPDPWRRVIAVDGEWEGNYPTDDGAYLRTIQFSSAHKEGITVVLRHQNGAPAFKPSVDAAISELQRLLLPDDSIGWKPRIGGHFLRADLPWFINAGLDLREGYAPPDDINKIRVEGGFETILQCHAVDETALFGLTEQTVKLTDAPAYDVKVREAVTARCKALNIKKDQLEGYGFLPQWVLHPEPTDPEWGYNYASLDADCTRRICMRHMEPGGLLDRDVFGNSSWEPYFNSHRASLGVLEMEMNGITVDFNRIDELTLLFIDVYNRLLAEFRRQANWPTFNPNSVYHKTEFLFGARYSAKIDKTTGQRQSIRPEGAMSLELTPLKTTGKRTKTWDKVVANREEGLSSPSTDKETMGILGYSYPIVMLLRDIMFVGQTLKGILRAPAMTKQGEMLKGEDGHFEYDEGIANMASSDGKVRTRIRQTMETGRASSSRPNLQSISSRREEDYRRILGSWSEDSTTGERAPKGQYLEVLGKPCYSHPIRSVLRSSPGHVLVEADYTGAELAAIAWLSGDQKMIDHVRRNALPEKHPEYYDMHSRQAVMAFQLDCEPTKKGLKDAGYPQFRNAAKCVVAGTLLQTSDGWLRVNELVGDIADECWSPVTENQPLLANDEEEMTPLVGLYNGGQQPCMQMTTDFGYVLESTLVHQYRVIDEGGNYLWRQAEELRLGDWVCVRRAVGPFGSDRSFPYVPAEPRTCFKPLDFPETFTEDWAAFLGLFVSEGRAVHSAGEVSFEISYGHCPEFHDSVQALLLRLFGDRLGQTPLPDSRKTKFRVSSVHLSRWLVAICGEDSHTRRVPEFVFQWPKDLLAVFMRWLFEGDGTAKENKSSFTIAYSTASIELSVAVQTLLLSFGVIASRVVEAREGYTGEYWAITLRGNRSKDLYLEHIGFVTPRKHAKCVSTGAYKQDRDLIPTPVETLRTVMRFIPGKLKEKCRECIRENSRIALSPTRLELILGGIDRTKLDDAGREAVRKLEELQARPASYQRVSSLQATGVKQVYDVTTTREHVVCYNGLLTHQSVSFGIPYGRGAEAISRQCQEEGTNVTPDECQRIIEAYYIQYPETLPFLDMCEERTQNPRWLAGAFGRYRRFQPTRNRSVEADQRRQGKNFPIQNSVADAVWLAIYNFMEAKKRYHAIPFRLLMQVHDSLLFEVPVEHLRKFVEDEVDAAGNVVSRSILHECMIDRVPVWPRTLDNQSIAVPSPYHFGIDFKVQMNWGESIREAEAESAGIPADLIA